MRRRIAQAVAAKKFATPSPARAVRATLWAIAIAAGLLGFVAPQLDGPAQWAVIAYAAGRLATVAAGAWCVTEVQDEIRARLDRLTPADRAMLQAGPQEQGR